MKKQYIIFYRHKGGVGNVDFKGSGIKNIEEVREIEKLIEDKYDVQGVIVTGWKEFKK